MARRTGTGLCLLRQLPQLLLWAFLKQDLHLVRATQATIANSTIANSTEATPHLLCNQTNHQHHQPIQPYYSYLSQHCLDNFAFEMNNISEMYWCQWEHIIRPYSNFQDCLEFWADKLCYPYPNEQAEGHILMGHQQYFASCAMHELYDPPDDILYTLIFIPICILPFLVALVVWKSKNGELQT
ncbi:receptor activity-modifying protein 2 [Ambystoma mexicanum]|uniref:receptor activity-modifying protein 2 n=1 Tax=Ambystoma mexicanum TaxID=8296 RepID=UPI0037E763F9